MVRKPRPASNTANQSMPPCLCSPIAMPSGSISSRHCVSTSFWCRKPSLTKQMTAAMSAPRTNLPQLTFFISPPLRFGGVLARHSAVPQEAIVSQVLLDFFLELRDCERLDLAELRLQERGVVAQQVLEQRRLVGVVVLLAVDVLGRCQHLVSRSVEQAGVHL